MAILSNVNGKFAVDSTGAVQFSGAAGTSGYVLKSNGTGSAPTWVDGSTVIGGPYLPLSGGTLTGATATASGISFTVGGALTVDGIGTFNTPSGGVAFNVDAFTDGYGVIRFRTNSNVSKWDVGINNSNHFYISNNGVNTALEIEEVSSNATFAGDIYGNDRLYLGTKMALDVNGTDLYLGSTTSANHNDTVYIRTNDANRVTITDSSATFSGNLNAGAGLRMYTDGSGNGVIYNLGQDKDLYLVGDDGGSGVNALVFDMSEGGNATFAGEITSGDDINCPTKIVIGESATAEVRLKKTNAGNGKLSFYNNDGSSSTQQAYLSLDASEDFVMYSAANNDNIFYAGGVLNLTMSGANSTFAGNVGIGGAPGQNLDIQKSGARFRLIDGTNQFNMGLWDGSNYRFEGDANRPIYMTSYEGNINFGISGGTTMTVQNAKVGIGTTSPQFPLNVIGASATEATVARFAKGNYADSGGHTTIVGLGTESGTTWTKAAIAFERTGGYDTGNIHFLQEDTVDNSTAELSDSVMTITKTGNVGIGTTSPTNAKFVINQNSSAASFGGNVCQLFENFNTTDGQMMSIGFRNNNSVGTTAYIDAVAYDQSIGATDIRFSTYSGSAWSSNMVTFQHTGRVGIGTTSPGSILDVVDTSGTTTLTLGRSGEVPLITAGGTNTDLQIRAVGPGGFLLFTTNGSSRMIIDSGGKVGIGTTSPTSTLSVQGTTNNGINVIGVGTTANRCYVGLNASNHGQLFVTGSSGQSPSLISSAGDNSYISGGNVGIGKTNPAYKLDVTGSIYCTASYVRASTAPDIWYSNNNTDTYTQTVLYMAQNNTSNNDANGYFLERGRISNSSTAEIRRWVVGARGGQKQMVLDGPGTLTVAGDLVAYGSPSDISLKENIKPIKNPLGKIKKLKGVTFDWKKSESILDIKEDYGFIAQDVQKVIPELVRKNENELLSMRHQGIIPILVEAIKELEARVKELENK